MDLPTGFDPITGTFSGVSAPRIQSNYNTTTYAGNFSPGNYSSYSNYSIWDRINDAIKSVGNWIDDIIEPVSGWISLISMIIGGIGLVIWVFSDANILYIILRFFGACIIGYVMMIGLGIALFCISLLMKIIRFIFWNGWTLLIALALAVGGWLYAANASNGYNYQPQTEVVTPVTRTYRCTAKVLNIRTAPNTSSTVIGTLRKGQQVEVYDTDNGFAQISYNGRTGYVSLKYLDRM